MLPAISSTQSVYEMEITMHNWKRRSTKTVLAAVTAVTVASAGMWMDSQTGMAVPAPGVTATTEASAVPADTASARPAKKTGKEKKARKKKKAARVVSSAGITTPEVTLTPTPSAAVVTQKPAQKKKDTKKTSDLGLTKQQTNITIWCIIVLAIGSISGITLTVTKKKNR